MSFTPKDWRDSPSDLTTPITAAALEDIETRVTDYTDTVTFNTQTTSYTLVLADRGKLVELNSASALNLTVPPNASVAFPVGSCIDALQYGAGQVTFVPGAGVTIRSRSGNLKTAAQYSLASLVKRATNEWILVGDLSP